MPTASPLGDDGPPRTAERWRATRVALAQTIKRFACDDPGKVGGSGPAISGLAEANGKGDCCSEFSESGVMMSIPVDRPGIFHDWIRFL